MRLSIVTTLYRSAPFVNEFYERASRAAAIITDDFEIVLVNDGSPDNVLEIAKQIADRDPRVAVIDFSRNFGHHKAIMTGIAQATGDYVFLIDVDLEEPPELLVEFWRRLHEDANIDVVYGQQEQRKGGWFERLSGNVYYYVISRLAGVHIPRNMVTVRLMSRRYVNSLLEYGEREMWLAGIWYITGYRQVAAMVNKGHKGDTTYTLRHKLSILVNSITAFSQKPLKLIFYTGFIISLLSASYVIYLVYQRLVNRMSLEGWTSVIASIWLLGGMIILFLGVIGIYLSKIFIEVKQRPYTIIREIYKKK